MERVVNTMEIIFEIIFELVFEGSLEISKNKKISKWIRYPLIAIISAAYLGLIGLFFWIGIGLLDENMLGAIVLMVIGLLLLIVGVLGFRKIYLQKK